MAFGYQSIEVTNKHTSKQRRLDLMEVTFGKEGRIIMDGQLFVMEGSEAAKALNEFYKKEDESIPF